MKEIKISNKIISDKGRVFIIAEAGINHNGSFALAKKLIDKAKAAGADCIKFQSFYVDKLFSKKETKNLDLGKIRKLQLKKSEFIKLFRHAKEKNIIFLSTPFDAESADFLGRLKVPAFKIGSGEITNLPLISHIAKKGLPVILSTGMATLDEVKQAVGAIKAENNKNFALLHCTSIYPPKPEEINLLAINTLKKTFDVPVGYSDHTEGIIVSVLAVALGARIIEKHFTLDKNLPGPDHKISLQPQEFKELVAQLRNVKNFLGDGIKRPSLSERKIRKSFLKSIVASEDILRDEVITDEKIAIKRPGTGLAPIYTDKVIGRKAKKFIEQDEFITFDKLK